MSACDFRFSLSTCVVLDNLSVGTDGSKAKNRESSLSSISDWHITLQNMLEESTSDTHHFSAEKCLVKEKETQFLES